MTAAELHDLWQRAERERLASKPEPMTTEDASRLTDALTRIMAGGV